MNIRNAIMLGALSLAALTQAHAASAAQAAQQTPSTGIFNVPVDQATVAGQPLATTLKRLQTSTVPLSSIGQPNGVAGLDGNGNVTANIVQPAAVPSASTAPSIVMAPSSANVTGLLYTSPYTQEPIIHFNVPQNDVNGQVWGVDPDAEQIGGDVVQDFAGAGETYLYQSLGLGASNRGSLGSETINCHPYGNYDAAACLTIFNGGVSRGGARAALTGGTEISPQSLSGYGVFENVDLELDTNVPAPRLMLQNVTYDATHVYMPGCGPAASGTCTPMTAQQMAQLRVGMTMTTNSIPPADVGLNLLGGQADRSLAVAHVYVAYVQSWDAAGKSITIRNVWSVFGDVAATGTTPSTTSLDTIWTNFNVPTVLFGAETSDSSEHHVIMNSYNPQGGAALAINQMAHSFTDGETDMQNFSPIDYSDTFRGPTYSYVSGNTVSIPTMDAQCNKTGGTTTRWENRDPKTHSVINLDACGQPNGHPVYPTSDSWGLFVAGGFAQGGGELLRLTGNPSEREIAANSMQMFAPYQIGTTAGSTGEIGEFVGNTDATAERMVMWLNRENTTNTTSHQVSMNLGYWANGTPQNQFAGTALTGTPWAWISWNHGSNLGGLDFLANNGTDMLSLDGAGDATVSANMNVGGSLNVHGYTTIGGYGGTTTLNDAVVLNNTLTITGAHSIAIGGGLSVGGPLTTPSGTGPTFPSFAMANLPTSTLSDGQHARCTDCQLNGLTGVDVVWNAASSKWTDMQNNTLHQ